jgi:hypothetical protein
VDKWLEAYVKSIVKLSQCVSTLETHLHGFLNSSALPSTLSEAVIDHDYTLLAARRYAEGAQAFWNSTILGLKKMDINMVEPIRAFLQNELRSFKVCPV